MLVKGAPGIVVACICVCARITKFGPQVQNNLVKVSIVLVAIDLELQSQIELKKSKIFPFRVCPKNKSPPIEGKNHQIWTNDAKYLG